MVEIEQDRRHGASLGRIESSAGGEQAGAGDLEMATVPQTSQWVADRRVGDLRVECDVGERQRHLRRDERQGLELERRVGAGEVEPADRQRADDLFLVEQRDRGRGEDVHVLGTLEGRGEGRSRQSRFRHDSPFGHGLA